MEERKPNEEPESCLAPGQENEVNLTDNNDDKKTSSLRLSTTLILQLGGLVAAGAVAFATANVKVEGLQRLHENEATASIEILRRVSELQAKVDYMTDELRYIRARTDRIVEQRKEKDQ